MRSVTVCLYIILFLTYLVPEVQFHNLELYFIIITFTIEIIDKIKLKPYRSFKMTTLFPKPRSVYNKTVVIIIFFLIPHLPVVIFTIRLVIVTIDIFKMTEKFNHQKEIVEVSNQPWISQVVFQHIIIPWLLLILLVISLHYEVKFLAS